MTIDTKQATFLKRVEANLAAAARDSGIFRNAILGIPSGKRLRPQLVYLSAEALDVEANEQLAKAATAIELVHVASLVHDDIIDDAVARRGVATLNAKQGINQALLVGDYLFASAYKMACEVNSELGNLIARTIMTLCMGEAAELAQRGNIDRNEQMVLEVMRSKTAVLTAAACQAAAICGSKNEEAMQRLGETFGMAFQLIDDVLDFIGDTRALGKPVGGDILEGNYTLPIVWTMRPQLKQMIEQRAPLEEIINVLQAAGTFKKAQDYLHDCLEKLAGTHIESVLHYYLEKVDTELLDKRYAKMFTARAATKATVASDTKA